MATEMQEMVKPIDRYEEGEILIKNNDDLEVFEFEIKDTLENEPVFSEVDGGVYISRIENSEEEYDAIESHLTNSGFKRAFTKKFIQCLSEKKGQWVADILGFKPVIPPHGEIDLSEIDILFGKLYIPTIDEFVTSIAIENTANDESDLSIKIPGFGSSGSKEFLCKITQHRSINSTPVNLVIPAAIKIVKWENRHDEYFYTYYPVNISRRMVGKRAENPYDHEGGYEELCKLQGIVDRFNTIDLSDNEEVSEYLEEKTEIDLSVNITLPKAPAIKIIGTATVNNKFTVKYSLPIGHEYATYVENYKKFQHIWAVKLRT